jgi:hypothetical protein
MITLGAQIRKLAEVFETEEKDLLVNYLSDKILYEVADEECAFDALKVAKEKVKYLTNNKNDR